MTDDEICEAIQNRTVLLRADVSPSVIGKEPWLILPAFLFCNWQGERVLIYQVLDKGSALGSHHLLDTDGWSRSALGASIEVEVAASVPDSVRRAATRLANSGIPPHLLERIQQNLCLG